MKTHRGYTKGRMSLHKAGAADILCFLFCCQLLQEIHAYCIFQRVLYHCVWKVALVLQNAAGSQCFDCFKKQLNKFREEKSIKSN